MRLEILLGFLPGDYISRTEQVCNTQSIWTLGNAFL